MSETLKKRVKVRYLYGEAGQLLGEEEETWEPLDSGSEFAGDDLTQSLDHGFAPEGIVRGESWRLYKVYEKKCIWIRHGEETKQ